MHTRVTSRVRTIFTFPTLRAPLMPLYIHQNSLSLSPSLSCAYIADKETPAGASAAISSFLCSAYWIFELSSACTRAPYNGNNESVRREHE